MKIELIEKQKQNDQFVYNLFCSHKIKELNAELWTEHMKQQICVMQFNAFEKSIVHNYENIKDLLIVDDGVSKGRLILSELENSILIVYIGVLTEYQNKGIGREILQLIIKNATEKEKKLSLTVSKNNPASDLYLKLGFVINSVDDICYSMTYTLL